MIRNTSIKDRLARVARLLDRAERWERLRLAFMEQEEAERLLQEHNDEIACSEGYEASRADDAVGPVGPRNEKNKSRYKMSPGHGQHLSDLLRHTAEGRSLAKISKLLNG